jgi:AcrR family transcriptional regulator
VLARKTPGRQVPSGRRQRSSEGGGIPAQQRVLRAQGRKTMRRLLEAGLAEFGARGLHAVSVDDVVRRAQTSHGTFYLYFSDKEDLFQALLRDALTALACLMMLERVNYLISVGVRLPRDEMADRLTAILYAAFSSPQPGGGHGRTDTQ